MLSITPKASEAIDAILNSAEAPDQAGLRIEASDAGQDSAGREFQLAIAPEPAEGDEVLADGNVFVEQTTAELLEDSRLDAEVEGGQVQFTLHQQAA